MGALLASAVAAPFAISAASAYAGAIGDGIGFYAVLLVRDLRRQPLASTVRGLVSEFGPAELLDTVAVRPLATYLCRPWLGDATAGVICSKIAADAVFYALGITAYEVRKHISVRRTSPRAR